MSISKKETKKLFYQIGEVAKELDVNVSLIRFWEKEFDIIKPKKTPNADFKDFLKFLFKIISPVTEPIIAPINIPKGAKNKPRIIPIDAPIIPYLLAPNFFEV